MRVEVAFLAPLACKALVTANSELLGLETNVLLLKYGLEDGKNVSSSLAGTGLRAGEDILPLESDRYCFDLYRGRDGETLLRNSL